MSSSQRQQPPGEPVAWRPPPCGGINLYQNQTARDPTFAQSANHHCFTLEAYLTPDTHPSTALPYGTADLDPVPRFVDGPRRQVGCYVRGCVHELRPPTRHRGSGDTCPDHGIRCHASTDCTYSYTDPRRNFIIDAELAGERVLGHPSKFESHRFGLENSEDALTWNVFRSFQRAYVLHRVAQQITGLPRSDEPKLFLWGISVSDNMFQPWDLLRRARERFETNLPLKRPLTEPDIALWLPGVYLILIEAKFISPNPVYTDGRRTNATSLTKQELLDIYQDRELSILDQDQARRRPRVHYQLWRNMVFAEWMARADAQTTRAYHANLTRRGHEAESCREFHGLVRPEFADRFAHVSWEELDALAAGTAELARLRKYLRTKTARLRQAFALN